MSFQRSEVGPDPLSSLNKMLLLPAASVMHGFFAYDGNDDNLVTNLWADILPAQQDRVPNFTGLVWQY